MAIITAEGISSLVLELLVRQLVLPRTVAAVPGEEFGGANGDTINVRVRQPRAAQTQPTPGAPINYVPIDEVSVPVQVAHLFDAVAITDEDLTLGVEDFASQVSEPQTAAVAIGAENQVAAVMNALAPDLEFAADGSDVEAQVLAARELLAAADVPAGNRFLAVSPQVATFLLKLEKVSRVDASGSPSALRDAVIGKLYGFTVVESAALDDGEALAYHRSAFVWANRPPVVPNGAASAAVGSREGVSLRQLFAFDPSVLSDVSVVSTFSGASAVTEDGETDRVRAVKFATEGSSS